MSEPTPNSLPVRQFRGLVTNEDSHDLAPGEMQVQKNLQIFSKGKAQVRKGMVPLSFENAAARSTAQIIAAAYFRVPGADIILYEDSDGNLKAGRNPTLLQAVTGDYTMSAAPASAPDFIDWLVDGSRRATTSTISITPPYAEVLDTTTCSNGAHIVQPRAYLGPYRNFDPRTISGCVGWWKFSDLTTLYTDSGKTTHVANTGDHIVVAVDKAGVCPDLTAAVGPTWNANQYNGLGTATAAASQTNQVLFASGTLPSALTSATTGDVFLVLLAPAANNSVLPFGVASASGSSNYLECQIQATGGVSRANINSSFTTGGSATRNLFGGIPPASTLSIINYRATGSGYDFWINGTKGTTTGSNNDGAKWMANLATANRLSLFGLVYGGGTIANSTGCTIAEVIIYDTKLSDADRAKVSMYLAEEYGTPYPDYNTVTFGTSIYGSTIPYTITDLPPATIYVNNPSGINLPTIRNKHSHIRIAERLFASPITDDDLAITQEWVDFGNYSITTVCAAVKTIASTTSIVQYIDVTEFFSFNIDDWLNYADINGHDREDAFWHVNTPTAFSLTKWVVSMPAQWFWDCQLVTGGGTPVNQYTGDMGWASANLQDGTGGSWANGDGGNKVTLGANVGDYVMVGFPDKFNEINFKFNTDGIGGAYTLIYPTSVNSDGTPATWATCESISDGTSNATADGKITFNPMPAVPWVPCVAKAGGSGLFVWLDPPTDPGYPLKGYYVGIKTTTAWSTTPICTTIMGCDYTNGGNTWSFTVPAFNYAHDLDGDGWLNDTEYSAAGSPVNGAGHPVRWAYQSRLPAPNGTGTAVVNHSGTAMRSFLAFWMERYLAAQPLYDGFFVDNSSRTTVSGVVEDGSTYATDYGNALATVWQTMAPSTLGQRLIIPNIGSSTALLGIIPASWHESMLRETDSWLDFESHRSTIKTISEQRSPAGIQVIDVLYAAGNASTSIPDDMKILLLAAYYCVARPESYFGLFADNILTDGFGPDGNISPNRWADAIGIDIGQPLELCQIYDSGTDPSDTAKSYRTYRREHENALIYYKPFGDTGSGTKSTDHTSSSNTPIVLPAGTFYPLLADGTLDSGVSGTINIHNQQAYILMKSN